MLACLKTLSRKYLFRSKEAENKELIGYHAIYGILDKYKSLLDLPYEKFYSLIDSKHNITNLLGTGLDFQWRLFNKLPEKYIDAYRHEYNYAQEVYKELSDFLQYEWFQRAHLIVDYVAGMTDNYVLETYNLLYGIKI